MISSSGKEKIIGQAHRQSTEKETEKKWCVYQTVSETKQRQG
jgi:hypothetical protein